MNANLIDYQQLKADLEFNYFNFANPGNRIQDLQLNHLNWELVDLLINGNCTIPIDSTMTLQYPLRQ